MDKTYYITQEYFDSFPELAEAGFNVGDPVTMSETGEIAKTNGDPILPPPHRPPIIP